MHRTFGNLQITRHHSFVVLHWSSGLRGVNGIRLVVTPHLLESIRLYGYRSTEGYPAPPPPPRYYHNGNNDYYTSNDNSNSNNSRLEYAPSSSSFADAYEKDNVYAYNSNNNNSSKNYGNVRGGTGYGGYYNYLHQAEPQYTANINALPLAAGLGTNERPIVVTPARQPSS